MLDIIKVDSKTRTYPQDALRPTVIQREPEPDQVPYY